MSFEPICDGHGGFRGSQPGKPNRLLVKSNAKTGAGKEQKNRRRDQLSLPFESKKARSAKPARRAAPSGLAMAPAISLKARRGSPAMPSRKKRLFILDRLTLA